MQAQRHLESLLKLSGCDLHADLGMVTATEAELAARLRQASSFGTADPVPGEAVALPGANFGPRRVPGFLRTSMHRLGLVRV